ncbi:MAG: hypothetical protein MSC31_11570 [Solirubrobacteraceae bacterium MAG38_C4-C5]|nr:hypothetical protein [Candidatus Siliceabacter maunaloa]
MTLGGTPAQATFPGENGRLACEGQRGPALPDPNPTNLSRTEVFTVNPDGTGETVLTNNTVRDGDPSFSPDGANIAFESFRDGFSEAYRIGSDGSNPVRLTTSGANEDRSTNWSPDGTKIVFHSTRDAATSGGNVPPGANPFEIYIMNADGSDQVRLTDNIFQDSFPQFSPDGSRIAFTTNRDGDFEIYTMNPDGTDPRRVTTSLGEDAHPTWSPDGTQLTFHSRRAGGIEIFRQNADGSGEATQLTDATRETDGTAEGGFSFFPVWSPDGTRIAFNGATTAVPDTEVNHVNAVDGSDRVRVTNSPGFDGRCDWEAVNPPPPPEPPVPPAPPAPPDQPPVQQPAPPDQPPVSPGPCGTPGAAGYLNPAKMRVSRARVLREDRRLDVLAPITSRARGGAVDVLFQADGRNDTFDVEVTEAGTELDEIRFLEPITEGQAELGTGIVNLNYLGDEDTRPEFVRLRAASQRAELDVEEISLLGGLLSAQGSVTSRAEGIVRFALLLRRSRRVAPGP